MAIANITNNILTDSGVATSALQIALNGTGFVKISGTTISYDNSTYALDSAVVKLTGTQTVGGAKTFSTYSKFDGGVILKNNVSASLAGYVGLSAYSASGNKGINIDFDTYSASFYFSGTLPYQYTFPAATGTLALTSDLSSYLPLTGGTLTGALNGTSAVFSSSVTAGGLLSVNGDATLVANFNYASNGTYARWQNNGTSFGDIGSAGSLVSGGSTNDFAIHARSTYNMVFATNFTERMRITSGGALCLGVTSAYGTNLLNVNGGIYATSSIAAVVAADIDMLAFVNTGATYSKACVVASMTATGGTGSYFFYGQQSTSTAAIKIFSNGNIQNTNNSYGAISDARLKENIKDATPKLDDLMKVKVRNYNLKGESNKQLGVISQELEAIFPNMIEESTNMGENMKIKGVKYSVFVPMLIKAVQELKAEIEILKNK